MKNFLSVLLFIFSASVLAEDTQQLHITSINTWSDSLIVTFEPEYTNSQNCSSTTRTAFILRNSSDPGNKAMISALLTAGTTGKEIVFRINGCGGGGYDYPLIERVKVLF